MRVAIVVLNFNNWVDTIECIESLLRLDAGEFRIIVCDNASQDNSFERLEAWGRGAQQPRLTHPVLRRARSARFAQGLSFRAIRSVAELASDDLAAEHDVLLVGTGRNGGFAYGNNVGLRIALRDPSVSACWLLNNDTVADPLALQELAARAASDPSVGLVGSTLLNFEPPHALQCVGGATYQRWRGRARPIRLPVHEREALDARATEVESRMEYTIGASMFATRAFLEEVGLLSEEYFLYFEEIDWAWRARGRFALGYAPRSVVYHRLGATTGESSGSAFSTYHLFLSRIKFVATFDPLMLPSTAMFAVYSAARLAWFGRWANAWAALRGTLLGLLSCGRLIQGRRPVPIRTRGAV